MSSDIKQIKIIHNGVKYYFTKDGKNYTKTYDNADGYYVTFRYKDEKGWLNAIKKLKKSK
jgi:hypothetical protein